jgi:hypothetical protein
MKLVKLAAAAFALTTALAAHSQIGVYGMYSATQYTGIQCLVAAPNTCSNGTLGRQFNSTTNTYGAANTGSISLTGGSGGVYYDFKTLGPVRLGVDFRGGQNHANKSASSGGGGDGVATGNYFLGGVRGSFHTPYSFLKPYAQISAGYAHSSVAEPTCQTNSGGILLCQGTVTTAAPRYEDNFLQYEGFAGADIRLFPILDLRVIELGIGNMNRIGSGNGSSSVGVRSIGAGVVFHLPTP